MQKIIHDEQMNKAVFVVENRYVRIWFKETYQCWFLNDVDLQKAEKIETYEELYALCVSGTESLI